MSRNRKATIAVSLVAAATTLLAACSGSGKGSNNGTPSSGGSSSTAVATTGYNAAQGNVLHPSTKTGGTLNLLANADCDSWDPGRTYYGWCWNMQRLISRTLVGWKTVNGTKFELAPDLATTLGQHNADFSSWSYTLKPGLKWENGNPITPMDIKYGLERLFATDVINGGPSSYFTQSIKAPKGYAGPYKGADDPDITATADSITINLVSPNANFDYLMAMSAAAPVPYKVEGGPGFVGATYTKHPVSSGPYKIESYTAAKEIKLVRNTNWDQSTDTIRHPLVDTVDLVIDTDADDIDKKLQAGTADARADNGVSPTFQAQLLTDPTLKANADDPPAASTRYMAVMPSVIQNVHCRLAIFYAFDKKAFQTAYGGTVAGDLAGSMTPPGLEGYDATLNPYPSGTDGTGDVAKAKDELQQCGKPNGFDAKFAYATPGDRAPAAFKAEKSALGRVGINLTAVTSDQSNYYSTFVGSPQNIKNKGIGMAIAAWGADFPNAVGFYQSIANGNSILPNGNSNYPSLNDPVVNKVLDDAPQGKATEADWKRLNQQIMQDAVYIPIVWEKTLYYRNPRMTNVTCDNALAFGIYDFVNIGVTK